MRAGFVEVLQNRPPGGAIAAVDRDAQHPPLVHQFERRLADRRPNSRILSGATLMAQSWPRSFQAAPISRRGHSRSASRDFGY
jgi:hypothetical protein